MSSELANHRTTANSKVSRNTGTLTEVIQQAFNSSSPEVDSKPKRRDQEPLADQEHLGNQQAESMNSVASENGLHAGKQPV